MADRISELERKVATLQQAVDDERRDRISSEGKLRAELEQAMKELALLDVENNKAVNYLIEYVAEVGNQYLSRELLLQEAIGDFNSFLKLPEKSNQAFEIWVAAWTIAASTIPALRLMTVFTKIEKVAQIELATAKAFRRDPVLMAKVMKAVGKGHNIADVVYKENNVVDKVGKVAIVGSKGVPPDATKAPIRELIAESQRSLDAVKLAVLALDASYEARVYSIIYKVPYSGSKETLFDTARRLLPPLPAADLEMIKFSYLWLILKGWVSKNVVFERKSTIYGEKTKLHGINDNQIDQLKEWFGLNTAGRSTVVFPESHILRLLGMRMVDLGFSLEGVK